MSTLHRVAFGGGAASLRTVPLREGRAVVVASATYAIVDLRYGADDAAHTLASGAATVDNVSTTLSANAGKGSSDPRALSVASAAGIAAGRRYLLQSGGRSELVKVEAVSGTTLRLAATLPQYFASGSTLSGVELVAPLSADVTGEDDYLGEHVLAVKWTPDGLMPWTESIYLERVGPAPLLSPEAVLELDPTLSSYAGEGNTVASALRQATDDWNVDMLAAGIEDSQILAGPIGRSAVLYRAAYHVIKHSSDTSAVSRAEAYAARYQELRASLLNGRNKAKVAQTNEDGAKQRIDVRSIFAAGW